MRDDEEWDDIVKPLAGVVPQMTDITWDKAVSEYEMRREAAAETRRVELEARHRAYMETFETEDHTETPEEREFREEADRCFRESNKYNREFREIARAVGTLFGSVVQTRLTEPHHNFMRACQETETLLWTRIEKLETELRELKEDLKKKGKA